MDSRDVPAKSNSSRVDNYSISHSLRSDKLQSGTTAPNDQLRRSTYLNMAGTEKSGRGDERRVLGSDTHCQSRKSNFNLLGFIKSIRESDSSSFEKRVTPRGVDQPKTVVELDPINDHSSGDEKLSRAFGVNLSYTRTPRVDSEQYIDSIELENPDIEKSMLTDELRTLRFCLNDDEDESDEQVNSYSEQKNSHQKHTTTYSALKRSTVIDTSLNPGSVRVIKNRKETSLFSTQDSRKVIHNSYHKDHHSTYLKDLNDTEIDVLSTVQEQGEPGYESAYGKEIRYENYEHYNMFDLNLNSGYQQHPLDIHKSCFTHYVPNIDMSLIKGITNQNMSQGSYSRYVADQSSDNKKQKKGKRNFWKVEDTSEFEISVENIYKERKTTLMIRNIPNKYTKELMLETIDAYFHDAYDFFYLPIDFKNNCNVGYAFINFKDLKHIEPFYKRFDKKKWAIFNSEKICSIKYARIQGKEECEKHFKDSSLMKQPVS